MGNRILIVEDKEDVRDSMCQYMAMAGFAAATAASAEEALDQLKQAEVDIVITDIVLPGMEGLELTQRVKKEHQADVIVMTGYSDNFSYEGAISIGASDFVIKPVRLEELLLRVKRVLRERELTEERNRMMEKLQTLAITDGLTGLFNSRHFYTQLELEVDRASRYQHPLSMLLIDIDHFKDFNDSYGHLEGDKVLARFSLVLKSCLRTNDAAYRYGGEEFTVILPETGAEEAELDPMLPLTSGNRIQLQQVAMNLMLNAFEAMNEHSNEERRLLIRTDWKDDQVLAVITDNGQGVPAGETEKIFKPFYTSKPQGLGMGLSICRSIINSHHGRLWVENNPDRGATFTVSLPVAAEELISKQG